jgi:hypothetical protein
MVKELPPKYVMFKKSSKKQESLLCLIMIALEWLAILVQFLILKHEKLNACYYCFGSY